MKKLTTALIFAGLFSAVSAQAATIEFDATKAPKVTNWTDTLSFGKFNTSLGTLTSIQFVLTGTVSGSGKGESEDSEATDITLQLGSTLTLSRPDASPLVVSNPVFSNTYHVSAYDGVQDYLGTSSANTGSVSTSATQSVSSTSASDFSLFSAIGGGSINLGLKAAANSVGSGAGNLDTKFSTFAAGNVKVIYTYTAAVTPVPEPETYGMMLLGLGLVGSIARRRAAKNKAV